MKKKNEREICFSLEKKKREQKSDSVARCSRARSIKNHLFAPVLSLLSFFSIQKMAEAASIDDLFAQLACAQQVKAKVGDFKQGENECN